jgi:resuscitation-promoting factor RpfA
VLAVNEPPAVKHFGRCSLSVIVNAKNTEPIFIKLLEDDVPLEKWPHVRDDLPISVAANDARVITVLWDQVPTHKKLATARRRSEVREEARQAQAEAAAAAEADATPSSIDVPPAVDLDDVPTVYTQAVPEPDPVGDEDGDLVPAAHGAGVVLDLPPSEYSVAPGEPIGTGATAVMTGERRRGKPSPRPRPRPAVDDFDVDATETVTALNFGAADPAASADRDAPTQTAVATPAPAPEAPVAETPPVETQPAETQAAESQAETEPIRIGRIGLVKPAIAAPDDESPYNQSDDTTQLADAYRAAAPPPGAARRRTGITVTLLISNLPRSIIFYRDVLGFREIDAGRGTAVLEFGDARVLLRVVERAKSTQRLVQMLLEVPDVDATYESLLARGVTFMHRPRRIGQYEQLELRAAAFRDPDGHGIAIAQWRSI